jgi:hypothetical protein
MSQTQLLPRAASRSTSAGTTRTAGGVQLQTILLAAGAVLLPLGLVVIILGWYGASKSPYQYDQLSYLISGGVLGLGLTFCGGFLYFGSWLARIAADQREASGKLADTLLVLADIVSQSNALARGQASGTTAGLPDPGAVLVFAGQGNTIHRADCALLTGRGDLHPAGSFSEGQPPCRVCKPEV